MTKQIHLNPHFDCLVNDEYVTQTHWRLAQTCVRDMWCVDWFNNEHTGGCYTWGDWWEDLLTFFTEDDVKTIRKMIDKEASVEDWWAFQEKFQ